MDQIFVHVRYKRTGVERKNVTIKAYNLIQKAYDFIGYVDAEGNPVEGPEKVTKSAAKVQQKKSAGRVGRPTNEEIQAKRAEMEAMNEASREKFKKEAEEKAKQKANA